MREYLKGKKTVILALLVLVRGAYELVIGDISLSEFINGPYLGEVLFGGIVLSGRAAVAKVEALLKGKV